MEADFNLAIDFHLFKNKINLTFEDGFLIYFILLFLFIWYKMS